MKNCLCFVRGEGGGGAGCAAPGWPLLEQDRRVAAGRRRVHEEFQGRMGEAFHNFLVHKVQTCQNTFCLDLDPFRSLVKCFENPGSGSISNFTDQ